MEKKPEVFEEESFRKKILGDDLNTNNVCYIGDTGDDKGIADVLARGNFIAPFYVSDEFKQEMAKEGALVPEDEADLSRFLSSG